MFLDEAFLLVTLENNWDRWTDMVKTGNDKKSKIPTKYTSKRRPKKHSTDENDSVSSDTSRSTCGWKDEGLERFNQFVEMLMAKRPHRKPLEVKYMEAWNKEFEKEITSNKRKRASKAAGIIQARNTLFEAAEPVAVDPNENPYGLYDLDEPLTTFNA